MLGENQKQTPKIPYQNQTSREVVLSSGFGSYTPSLCAANDVIYLSYLRGFFRQIFEDLSYSVSLCGFQRPLLSSEVQVPTD